MEGLEVEYADDIFSLSELNDDELFEINNTLLRGDIDPTLFHQRIQVEENQRFARHVLDGSIGQTRNPKRDQSLLGAIGKKVALCLVHEKDDDDIRDTEVYPFRESLVNEEGSEYASRLIQIFLRCTSQQMYKETADHFVKQIKERGDDVLKQAYKVALKATENKLRDLPPESDEPIDVNVADRDAGQLSFLEQESVQAEGDLEQFDNRYTLWKNNIDNAKKTGWQATKFSFTCPRGYYPALCLDEAREECVVATYYADQIVHVYRVSLTQLGKKVVPVQVELPAPFEDLNPLEEKRERKKRLPSLFCRSSARGGQVVVGYGDGVFVLDQDEFAGRVFHHLIKPPGEMFRHMITSAAFGVGAHHQLFLGTRAGHVWMTDYTMLLANRRPSYTFTHILPVRDIFYCPHHSSVADAKGKLVALNVSEVAFLDGPVLDVRTATHVGRSIVVDRPMSVSMCGAHIYILSKAGYVRIECVDPEAKVPILNDETQERAVMMFPPAADMTNKDRLVCMVEWMTPWYQALYSDIGSVHVLYPDGFVNKWVSVRAE